MALTTITNSMVSVNAIQGTLIADNAITAVHIATNAVSGTLIADNAITATHIAQNIITVTQLADDAVEGAKIADSVITTNHLNKAMISSQTEVSAVAGDYVLLGDTSDSNNLKKAPISSILAGTLTTAAQTNITSLGTLTALTVDDMTLDGSTLSDGGTFKIDAGGNIRLDADGGSVILADGGTDIGRLENSSSDYVIHSLINDKDIIFKGIDGGSTITALTLDMSDEGTAKFGHDIKMVDNAVIRVGTGNDLSLFHDASNSHITNDYGVLYIDQRVNDGNFILRCDDGSGGLAEYIALDGGSHKVVLKKATEIESSLEVEKAGDGNTPILHVKDTADTEVAWFEGNRAGDTGAFIAIRHNPSSAAESNRSGIKFQADDDGGNVTNYAQIKQYIEDNTGGTEDGRLGINIMSDGTDNEVVNIRKDQFIYKGDAGSSMFRIDNRADGHDVGFEIYQNGGRKWEIVNDDSHANQLDFRPGGSSEVFCIRDDGRLRVGLAPDIAGFLTVQKSNAGVPVFYAKNTNADSLAIRAEVNANSANNAIIEAVNSDGGQFKIRNDGTCFTNNGNVSSLSDQRLKTNIVDYTYDVAKFKSLRTRKFNWRNKEIHGNKDNIIGFIAQEVNIADSRWVDQGEISKDSQDKEYLEADLLAYSTPLTETDAMYVSVIQQLITRLETAEAKIAALE